MFLREMTDLSNWIVRTPPSRAVQGLQGYVALTQSLHILAIAALSGCTAMLNLRVLGVMNRGEPVAGIAARYSRPVWIAVLVLLATGLALLLAEPKRSLTSQVFQLKMLLLAVAIVLTLRLQRAALRAGRDWDGGAPAAARVPALASLLLWICIIFAGRWIAYAQY